MPLPWIPLESDPFSPHPPLPRDAHMPLGLLPTSHSPCCAWKPPFKADHCTLQTPVHPISPRRMSSSSSSCAVTPRPRVTVPYGHCDLSFETSPAGLTQVQSSCQRAKYLVTLSKQKEKVSKLKQLNLKHECILHHYSRKTNPYYLFIKEGTHKCKSTKGPCKSCRSPAGSLG